MITDYITEKEENDFCRNCNEICSRHCAIYRNAKTRYDNEIKLFDVKPTLISRLWECLDTYEIRDNDYTITDLKSDLVNHPHDIIEWLVSRLEDLEV